MLSDVQRLLVSELGSTGVSINKGAAEVNELAQGPDDRM